MFRGDAMDLNGDESNAPIRAMTIDEFRHEMWDIRQGLLSFVSPLMPRGGTNRFAPFSSTNFGNPRSERERTSSLYADNDRNRREVPSFPSRPYYYPTTLPPPAPSSVSFQRAHQLLSESEMRKLRDELNELKKTGQTILENQRRLNRMVDHLFVVERYSCGEGIGSQPFSNLDLLLQYRRQDVVQVPDTPPEAPGIPNTIFNAPTITEEPLRDPMVLTSLRAFNVPLRELRNLAEEEAENETAKKEKGELSTEDLNNMFDVPPDEFSNPPTPRCLSRSSEKAETARYIINNMNRNRTELIDHVAPYWAEETSVSEQEPNDEGPSPPATPPTPRNDTAERLEIDEQMNDFLNEWEDLDDEDLDDQESAADVAYREWDMETRRENIMSLFEFQLMNSGGQLGQSGQSGQSTGQLPSISQAMAQQPRTQTRVNHNFYASLMENENEDDYEDIDDDDFNDIF